MLIADACGACHGFRGSPVAGGCHLLFQIIWSYVPAWAIPFGRVLNRGPQKEVSFQTK